MNRFSFLNTACKPQFKIKYLVETNEYNNILKSFKYFQRLTQLKVTMQKCNVIK